MDAIPGVLGESSVRAIVITIAVAGILRGMLVKSPVICHRAWTGLLLVMLFLPIISLWAPRIAIPLLPPASSVQIQKAQDVVLGQDASQKTRVSTAEAAKTDKSDAIKSWWPAGIRKRSGLRWGASETLFICYSIGFLILIVRLLAGTLFSYRLSSAASRHDKGFYISRISAPLTIGLLRPRILLPAESRDWDSGMLSVVLTHEKEHVRRRDPLVEWLSLLNRCIYWFHPLAWWLCGKLSALAEQSCDEAVIASGHDRFRYAEHLLDFAHSVKQKGALVAAWGSSLHGSTLALRIRRIVEVGRSPAISRLRLVLVTALCAGASLIPAICELTHAQAAALPALRMSDGTPRIWLPETTAAQDHQSQTPSRGTPLGKHALSSPTRGTAPDGIAVAASQSSHPISPIPTDTVLYDAGLKLLEKHRYEDARKAFQTLINTYPDSEFSALSYLAIGDTYLEEGGKENLLLAEDQYKNFVIFFPTHPKAATAQAKLFTIYMKMMSAPGGEEQYRSKAQRAFDRLVEQFPDSEYVPILRQYATEIPRSDAKGNSAPPIQQSKKDDRANYYRMWLNQDVIYIITKEEKEAFLDLKSDEERQHFIEQFWARRNPDPGSRDNIYKEEHYRRLDYANKRFGSGVPGWKTDRGRIYIMYGPPGKIESHPQSRAGEFPYELWYYSHIEGIGEKVAVEFVDKGGTGEYSITREPEPKKGIDIK